MLRYIVLTLIFIACSYLGITVGRRYVKRHRDLKEVEKYIISLSNEILYNNTPIPEALIILSTKSNKDFSDLFNDAAKYLISGEEKSIFDSFKKSYEIRKEKFYFSKDDEKILGDFLKAVGSTGIYGQEKIFDLVRANLDINIKDSLEIANKNSKLYSYIGILSGAMIVIFLI